MARSVSIRTTISPDEVSVTQQLGAKGQRTRQKIMEATAELLRERAFGGVTRDLLLNPDRCTLVSH